MAPKRNPKRLRFSSAASLRCFLEDEWEEEQNKKKKNMDGGNDTEKKKDTATPEIRLKGMLGATTSATSSAATVEPN